jgi:hypothetical protein
MKTSLISQVKQIKKITMAFGWACLYKAIGGWTPLSAILLKNKKQLPYGNCLLILERITGEQGKSF